jgi:hypothetical protein
MLNISEGNLSLLIIAGIILISLLIKVGGIILGNSDDGDLSQSQRTSDKPVKIYSTNIDTKDGLVENKKHEIAQANGSNGYGCEYSSEANKQANKFNALMSGLAYGSATCINFKFQYKYEIEKAKTLQLANKLRAIKKCGGYASALRDLVNRAKPLEDSCNQWRNKISDMTRDSARRSVEALNPD